MVAGFVGLLLFVPMDAMQPAVDGLWAAFGVSRPEIAWPWYPVVAGGINIAIAWLASIALDGRQQEWHPHSVPGQKVVFAQEGRPEKEQGWYTLPGRVEPVVWLLPVFFVLIILFLAWFGTLG